MFLGFARGVAVALCGLSSPPPIVAPGSTAAVDDAARSRHPWARFQPGSWVSLRTTTDAVLGGTQRSTQGVTLKSVTEKGVKLATETRKLDFAEIVERTVPLDEGSPWILADVAKAKHEVLTIEGKEIPCAVVPFDRVLSGPADPDVPEVHTIGTAWWSDAYPVPLKVEVETTDGEVSIRRRTITAHLDVELKVGERSLHCVESVTNTLDDKGQVDPKSETRAWSCAEVPGAIVRLVAQETDDDGESTARTELLDFFIAPTPPVTRVSEALPKPPVGACVITGRFMLEDGRSAEGVPASVSGRTCDTRAASKSFKSPEEVSLERKTDAEGRIRFEVEALPGAEYFVEVRGPGLAKEEWRLRDLLPGGRVDLGDIKMRRSGSIVGTMTTAEGRPVSGGFYVMARQKSDVEEAPGSNRESMYEYGVPEKGSTEYRVDNIPAGTYEVEAQVEAFGWFEDGKRIVEVTEGRETRLDLVYSGPDLSHRVRVVVFVDPFYSLDPRPDRITLQASDGRAIAATHCDSQTLDFDGVPDGPCTLTIDDPRFAKVVRTGLHGGARTDIELRGAGSVTVIAKDAEDSKAIEDVVVSQQVGLGRFLLRGYSDPPLENGLLRGVLPGNSLLYVSAKGYAETTVELNDLEAGAPRTIEVALTAGGEEPPRYAVLAGVVRVSKRATPVAGAVVRAERTDGDWESKGAFTDAAGAYRFEGLPAGHWSLRASRSTTVVSPFHKLELDPGERREDVDLELPLGVDVVGKVVGLGVLAREEPRLAFTRVVSKAEGGGDADSREGDDSQSPGRQEARIDRAGTYSAKAVAPGRYRVDLEYGGKEFSNGPSHAMVSPTQHARLAEVEITEAANQHLEFDASGVAAATIHARVECDVALRGFLLVVARPAEPPAKEADGEASTGLDGEPDATDEGDEDENEHVDDEEWFDVFESSAFDDLEGEVPGAVANLAPDGSARLTLPPGRWRVGARHSGGEWTIDAPKWIEVKGGDEVEISIKVEVVPGSIRLVEAGTQRPLAQASIRWTHATATRRAGVTARTNGDGVLSLALPRGKVTLSIAPRSSRSPDLRLGAVEIDWPPAAEAVTLRRKPTK